MMVYTLIQFPDDNRHFLVPIIVVPPRSHFPLSVTLSLIFNFPPRSFLSVFTLPLIVMLIFPNEHASISEEHYAET
jgi:hypothetical protein